jgi:hypothetical protein
MRRQQSASGCDGAVMTCDSSRYTRHAHHHACHTASSLRARKHKAEVQFNLTTGIMQGATRVYGPQKGILQQDEPWFEQRLLHMFGTLPSPICNSFSLIILPPPNRNNFSLIIHAFSLLQLTACRANARRWRYNPRSNRDSPPICNSFSLQMAVRLTRTLRERALPAAWDSR